MSKRKHKKSKKSRERQLEYDYHLPVFRDKAIDLLLTDTNATYIDGTLGGGGHAAEILKRLESGGKLIAFDLDEEAISHCLNKFEKVLSADEFSRLEIRNQSFEAACSIKCSKGILKGLLLDLGVSSRQLDSEAKGFSYRVKTSLDMRFSNEGDTAEGLLNSLNEDDLIRVLREYGEEPFAKLIAKRIVDVRRITPLKDTFQLRQIVEESVPPKMKYSSLSRVFQAFRIAVNKELQTLENTLTKCIPEIEPGGRIVVISYHSLEDRIVKNTFKKYSNRKVKDRHAGEESISVPKLKIKTKKPLIPGKDEIEQNPRARSAKMRVAERIADSD